MACPSQLVVVNRYRLAMTADAWAAFAQWVTAAIALGAAVFAYFQVIEARKTREKVAQPDVVVYIEHSENDWQHFDLVIKNYGQTPAYNIQLTLPPLQRVPLTNGVTGEEVTEVYVPKSIAVLAPGQEWRSMWDDATEREKHKESLRTQFVGSVSFDDKMVPDKASYSNPISLDTNMFYNTMRVGVTEKSRTTEKALYEIAGTLKGFTKEHGGVWVYAVPGEDEHQYLDKRAAYLKERHERTMRQLRGEPDE